MTKAPWRLWGWRLALALGAGAAGGSLAAAASALDLYYERSLMVAADGRCGLFQPELGAALASAQAQARGAALRSGAAEDALAEVMSSAGAKAGSVSCRSPDLAVAAGRVRAAFVGYSRLQRMTFAGDLSSWQAQRYASAKTATWRLSQPAAFGPDRAIFGLGAVGREPPSVMAVAAFADGAWPYAARLVARDRTRAPRPLIGGLAPTPVSRAPLSQRIPPRAGTQVILAQARSLAEPQMLPVGAKTGVLFRFPPGAAETLRNLDPREAVVLEFLFAGQGRDQVRAAYFEVGDFAAGQAFLKVALQ